MLHDTKFGNKKIEKPRVKRLKNVRKRPLNNQGKGSSYTKNDLIGVLIYVAGHIYCFHINIYVRVRQRNKFPPKAYYY
jgi:hypothetical protein